MSRIGCIAIALLTVAPALADKDRVAEEVAREWQQVRLRERMDWLYNYDATAIAV